MHHLHFQGHTYIAEYCDQPKEKIEEDCDRDCFVTAEEAKDYGMYQPGSLAQPINVATG